ncbi:MAG TPA: DUF4390 domain-containing protein [Crenotrichaceae bacterium]|nr:DUF4390 domain-containing protein [Crenotrichaceae bacterium]
MPYTFLTPWLALNEKNYEKYQKYGAWAKRKELLETDKTEWRTTLPYQIRYLALSKSYELINESSGSRRNFASRGVAIAALGKIRSMPVAKSICPMQFQCSLLIKVTLNREGLPLPLRPAAYVSLDWYLSSRWKQWPLTS